MNYDQYINRMRQALKNSGAHAMYFPPNKKDRKRQNLLLARELGFGLKDYPDRAGDFQALYGMMVVANSFDSTGVAIDAGPWLRELRKAAGLEGKNNA